MNTLFTFYSNVKFFLLFLKHSIRRTCCTWLWDGY